MSGVLVHVCDEFYWIAFYYQVSVADVPNGTKIAADSQVAKGEEALTVMEYVATRTQVVNELLEVNLSVVVFSQEWR